MSFFNLRKLIAIVIVALTLSPSVVFADYKGDYQQALKQIESERWKLALDSLNKIREFDQQETVSMKIAGGKSIPYLPKYYKGLAEFHLGMCEQADSSLISSLAQQVVQAFKSKHDKLLKMRAVCKSRLVDGRYVNKLAPNIKLINGKKEKLATSIDSIKRFKKQSPLKSIWSKGQYFSNNFALLEKQYEQIDNKFDTLAYLEYSQSNVSYLKSISSNLDRQINSSSLLEDKLSRFLKLINRVLEQLERHEGSKATLVSLQGSLPLKEDWAQNGKLRLGFSELNKSENNLSSQTKTLFAIKNESELKSSFSDGALFLKKIAQLNITAESLIKYANDKIKNNELKQQSEKRAIYAGVDAYFAGRYASARSMLTQAEVQDDKGRFFKNLFIAAAYFYDPSISESEARDKARSHLILAKNTREVTELDARIFSPRFIAFYNEVAE